MIRKINFVPDIHEIKRIRDEFKVVVAEEKIELNSEQLFYFEIVIGEIVSNAIKYGVKGPNETMIFIIKADRESVEFEMEYTGSNITQEDVEKYKNLPEESEVFNLKESGRGTFIVNKIMDNVEYKQSGNRSIVRMIKKI